VKESEGENYCIYRPIGGDTNEQFESPKRAKCNLSWISEK